MLDYMEVLMEIKKILIATFQMVVYCACFWLAYSLFLKGNFGLHAMPAVCSPYMQIYMVSIIPILVFVGVVTFMIVMQIKELFRLIFTNNGQTEAEPQANPETNDKNEMKLAIFATYYCLIIAITVIAGLSVYCH